jgi:hypothetical protein
MKIMAFLFILICFSSTGAQTIDPLKEIRYCGQPERDSKGNIMRSQRVLAAFKKSHFCPSTMATTGACPGWQMDHIIPLVCGGCDAVWNLQWLPIQIKTCKDPTCKDRFEQRINCTVPLIR